jgi:hypothetical protein
VANWCWAICLAQAQGIDPPIAQNEKARTEFRAQNGLNLCRVVFDLYAKGFQEFNVLIAHLEFRVAGQSGDH